MLTEITLSLLDRTLHHRMTRWAAVPLMLSIPIVFNLLSSPTTEAASSTPTPTPNTTATAVINAIKTFEATRSPTRTPTSVPIVSSTTASAEGLSIDLVCNAGFIAIGVLVVGVVSFSIINRRKERISTPEKIASPESEQMKLVVNPWDGLSERAKNELKEFEEVNGKGWRGIIKKFYKDKDLNDFYIVDF